MAADALHQRVFNLSVFYRNGAEAIWAAGSVGGCTGILSIYNPPAISITPANSIANIAVNSSSTSFIMLRRTARDILPTQQNVAPWIKFRTGLLRTFSNCPVRSARHFVRHGKASREQSCFPALPESRPLSSIPSPCPSSGLPPAAMRSSSSLTLRTASTGGAHPCFGQTRAKSRIDQINRVDGSAR
jgi:hypothetical protein